MPCCWSVGETDLRKMVIVIRFKHSVGTVLVSQDTRSEQTHEGTENTVTLLQNYNDIYDDKAKLKFLQAKRRYLNKINNWLLTSLFLGDVNVFKIFSTVISPFTSYLLTAGFSWNYKVIRNFNLVKNTKTENSI